MRRRALLGSLAATLSAGAAGCISDSPTGSEPPTDTQTPTDTPTDVHTTEQSPTSDPSMTPPPTATDVFADFDCPSFHETERTVCYHEVDPTEVPLVLTAEPEVFDPDLDGEDIETLDFKLYNRSEWNVGFNPYDWGIERYDDGEWTHVAPEMYPEPWLTLKPAQRYTWSLPSAPHPSPSIDRQMGLPVPLDPGIYAFHVSVVYEASVTATDTEETPPPSGHTELVALFRIEQAIDSTGGSDGTDDGIETETGSVDEQTESGS